MQQTRRDVRKPANNFKPLPTFRVNLSDSTDCKAMRSTCLNPRSVTAVDEDTRRMYKYDSTAIWTELSERGIKSLLDLV
jgi:hypothetical protein